MEFKAAVKHVLNNYATFNGRAVRSEYWYWILFAFIAQLLLSIVDGVIGTPLSSLFSLATLVPGIAVATRRLHDIDKSGWWQLIALTVIGIVVLIYWYCQKGNDGANRFGAPAPTA